jgi:hypothetical protein
MYTSVCVHSVCKVEVGTAHVLDNGTAVQSLMVRDQKGEVFELCLFGPDIEVMTLQTKKRPSVRGGDIDLGNTITAFIEAWGAGAGYWENDELLAGPSIHTIADLVESLGMERQDLWDLADPHVHYLSELED